MIWYGSDAWVEASCGDYQSVWRETFHKVDKRGPGGACTIYKQELW